MPDPIPTHYQVLMLDPDVDADVLAVVYGRHVQRLAGVTGGRDAATRLLAIEQAYAVLRDPFQRRRYDADLRLAADRTERQDQPDAPVGVKAAVSGTPVPASPRMSAATAVRAGVLDFGRYAGWSLRQIAMRDRDYLEWLRRTPGGRQYQTEIATILGQR